MKRLNPYQAEFGQSQDLHVVGQHCYKSSPGGNGYASSNNRSVPLSRLSPECLVKENNCSRLRMLHAHPALKKTTPKSTNRKDWDVFEEDSGHIRGFQQNNSSWFLHSLHRLQEPSSLREKLYPSGPGNDKGRSTSVEELLTEKWYNRLSEAYRVNDLSSVDRRGLWRDICTTRSPVSSRRYIQQREILLGSNNPVKYGSNDLGSTVDASGTMVDSDSPFMEKIVQLRIEGLRLEEDILLERKRKEELESFPTPGWHALRTNQFHFEARKNTMLLRSGLDPQHQDEYFRHLTMAGNKQ